MLKRIKNYYVGKSIQNPEQIFEKISQGKPGVGIYLVTFSEHPDHLLELFSSAMLLQKSFVRHCPEIVGMARGKQEAMELVSEIIQEVYRETGSFCIKEYLKNR